MASDERLSERPTISKSDSAMTFGVMPGHLSVYVTFLTEIAARRSVG